MHGAWPSGILNLNLSPIGVLFDCPSRNDPSGYLQYERWELGCFMHWGTCQNSQEKVYHGLTEVFSPQGAASPTDHCRFDHSYSPPDSPQLVATLSFHFSQVSYSLLTRSPSTSSPSTLQLHCRKALNTRTYRACDHRTCS
jgi:hypothetical protein